MQSSSQAGESSSTQPLMQDSGRPGDAWTAQPEGAGIEETRRPHPMVRRTERGLGATPALTVNRAGRCRIRGDSETPSEGAEDGARIGGDPGTHRHPSRKVQDSRRLGNPIRRRGGRSEDWGQPRHSPSTEPEGAGFEATRKPHLKARRTERELGATPALTVNRAGRCGNRGNSGLHSKADREDAWFE